MHLTWCRTPALHFVVCREWGVRHISKNGSVFILTCLNLSLSCFPHSCLYVTAFLPSLCPFSFFSVFVHLSFSHCFPISLSLFPFVSFDSYFLVSLFSHCLFHSICPSVSWWSSFLLFQPLFLPPTHFVF